MPKFEIKRKIALLGTKFSQKSYDGAAVMKAGLKAL